MPTNEFQCENGSHTSCKFFSWPILPCLHSNFESKFCIPHLLPYNVRRHQPSTEELAASLERKSVLHGVPMAVDRWITCCIELKSPSCDDSCQLLVLPLLVLVRITVAGQQPSTDTNRY